LLLFVAGVLPPSLPPFLPPSLPPPPVPCTTPPFPPRGLACPWTLSSGFLTSFGCAPPSHFSCFQGGAADVVMMAMLRIHDSQVLARLGWKLLLQVRFKGGKEGGREGSAGRSLPPWHASAPFLPPPPPLLDACLISVPKRATTFLLAFCSLPPSLPPSLGSDTSNAGPRGFSLSLSSPFAFFRRLPDLKYDGSMPSLPPSVLPLCPSFPLP